MVKSSGLIPCAPRNPSEFQDPAEIELSRPDASVSFFQNSTTGLE